MKNVMRGIVSIVVMSSLYFGGLAAENRTGEQVFGRWFDVDGSQYQQAFRDMDVATMAQDLDQGRRLLFNERFAAYRERINSFGKFFVKMGIHPALAMTQQENNEFSAIARQELTTVYKLLQNNIPGFVSYLKKSGFESEALNKREAATYFNDVIERHKALMSVLFARANSVLEEEYLFTVANHFFEYCFVAPTWKTFAQLLKTPKDYPIVRLLYSTMWYNLAGNGWKNWHEATLKALQEKCQQSGTSVTYIAGGSDLYQLLNHEIYNIRVIDPMLPTQPRYYSEGWDWLVRSAGDDGGIGDEFTMKTKCKDLLLKRFTYQEKGSFSVPGLDGASQTIPQSVTVWNVFDQVSGQRLGELTFDRRFCTQDDFVSKPDQFLLMSFNELYFVTTAENDNWGIDPRKFPKNFTMFVKQLRCPVNKEVACHLRQADKAPFGFIKLGTSVT